MSEKLVTISPRDELFLNEDGTRKEEYLNSLAGQAEVGNEKIFDKIVETIDRQVERGEITHEEALSEQEKMLDIFTKNIDEVRDREYNRQRQEKIQALANIFAQVRDQKDTGARLANIMKQVKGDEDNSHIEVPVEDSVENHQKDIEKLSKEEIEAEIARLKEKWPPLVAINVDATEDKQDLADDLAEIDLNEELENSGFLKKIWKGRIFRKAFHKAYAKEYFSGERTQNINGAELSIDEILNRRKRSAIERFVKSVVEDEDAYIHVKAGEELAKEADEETTAVIKEAIEGYASAPEDADEETLREELNKKIERIPNNGFSLNNFMEIAIKAREFAKHYGGLDRVMEGFKVYNAKVRDGVRTEAHRKAIDKIINWDRTRMFRDTANGMVYEGSSDYADEIGNTLYDSNAREAKALAIGIKYAMTATDGTEEQRKDAVLDAIAEARARIDFSDENKKDLITYSSEGARGRERLALDATLIEAERSLSDADRDKLEEKKAKILERISEEVDEKDADFKKLRRAPLADKGLNKPRRVISSELRNEIRADAYGLGHEFIGFITELNSQGAAVQKENKNSDYADWWDKQDEYSLKRAASILRRMRRNSDWLRSNWGASFMNWVQINHPEVMK